jgi:hypothetical protein
MDGVGAGLGSGELVLTRVCAVTITATSLGAGVAHAGDGFWPDSHSIEASAQCQQPTSACTAHLAVSTNGQGMIVSRSARRQSSPAPTSICHYGHGFVYDTPASVRAHGGAFRIEVVHRVCPAGAENLGAPWAFNPEPKVTAQTSARSLVCSTDQP